MKQTIAIIHFNTPELTEACILSLRKTGCAWPVILLDNSDKRPFTKKMNGVKVLDNTRQQLIDFDTELEKFPDRIVEHAIQSNFGSMKHCMSVQYLWDAIPDGFILLESDTIVKKDIRPLWQEEYSDVGEIRRYPGHEYPVADRLLPFLLYMNVPKLKAAGARFYDPKRCWMLQGDINNAANWFDTGACLLDDVRKMKPQLVGKTIKVSELEAEGYKGIFVGSGAGLPNFMNIEGENLINIMSSNEYLTRVNLMDAASQESDTPVTFGKKMMIVGGGNTAMDSVRTALRLGAERAMITAAQRRRCLPVWRRLSTLRRRVLSS